MKSIVVYFSLTGNTRKVAEAICSGIRSATGHCEITALRDADADRLVEFDLIGLGCPVYGLKAPPNVRAFEERMPTLEGKHCFLFATHGSDRGMVFRDMGELLLQKRLVVIGYHSWYGGLWNQTSPKPYFTDGHPDSVDLKEAAAFGKEMVERSLKISQGETGLIADILSIKERTFPSETSVEMRLNKGNCRYPICRLCVDNCPIKGCIDLSREPIVFAKQDRCISCYFCELICPTGAIEVDWEPFAAELKEKEVKPAAQLLERAKARGYFRSLVNKVDADMTFYKVSGRPRFIIEISPCTVACPIHIHTPGYLSLVTEGRLDEAYQLIRRANPLPAICGRLCHHPCEQVCNRRHVDQPLAIASVERFVTDQINIEDLEVPQVNKNGKRVAIIGSGPAGLAAAHDLALCGYEVTIFEALPEAGGILRARVPEYRLPKHILGKEIGYIKRLGVEIETNTRIGEQVRLEKLLQDYQALFVATGAQESLRLGIPGEENPAVIPGIELLTAVNTGRRVVIANRVAVIGGGDIAIDAARVVQRLGGSVTIVYQRSRVEMPATSAEVNAAAEEGIGFMFLTAPVELIAKGGKLSGMKCVRTTLGAPDASGRRRPIPVEASEFTIEVDAVIPAVGQKSNLRFIEAIGAEVSSQGKLVVDGATLATSIEDVFAGGEVVSAAAKVIHAVAAGKRAARSIDNHLREIPLTVGQTEVRRIRHKLTEEESRMLREKVAVQDRAQMKELAPEERIANFGEVDLGFDLAQAQQEANRCLKCEWKP